MGSVIEDIVAVHNASGGEFRPTACCAQPTSTRRRAFAAVRSLSPKNSASRGCKQAEFQHQAEAGEGAASEQRMLQLLAAVCAEKSAARQPWRSVGLLRWHWRDTDCLLCSSTRTLWRAPTPPSSSTMRTSLSRQPTSRSSSR